LTFVPAAQEEYPAHVPLLVQQLDFFVVSETGVVIVVSAFAESQYMFASHATAVTPPHFVVSAAQHVSASPAAQLLVAQYNVEVFGIFPAGHTEACTLPVASARTKANTLLPAISEISE